MPNSRSRSAVLCAAVAALFSGCQEQANPTQPQTARSSAVVARYLGPVRPGEASFAQLAEKAPSSAGFYFNQAHDLVVVVRDPSDASAATTALQSMVAARQISLRHGTAPNVVVQHGKYTFAELATWRDALSDALLGQVNGVTSIDLNEQSNRVVVGLDPAVANAARQSVSEVLRKLAIDSGGVTFRNVKFVATNGDSITSQDDSLAGGIFLSTVTEQGCTLGFIADIGTQRAFITASHCTPTVFHLDLGSPAYQKFQSDSLVGTEYVDPAPSTCGLYECRRADAAAYKVTTFPTKKGLIVRTLSRGSTSNGSFTVDPNHPYFIINGTAQSITGGDEINKMGVGAGWTWGGVTNTCVDLHITSGTVTYIVKCAYEGDYRSRPGDSGGPIFSWDGGDAVSLLGVNFGVSTDSTLGLFSAYADITAILGTMTVVRGTNLATPLLSGQVSEGLPALSWAASSGASRYDIYRDTFDNQTGTTSGLVYIGSTNVTSYRDEIPVTKYDGTSNPGPRVPGFVLYQIYAASSTDLSATSRDIYFTTP